MKAIICLAAGLGALAAAELTVVETKEPASTTAESLRVVGIGKMSVERAAHQATLLATNQVLITGGCAGQGCERILASAEVYDPTTRAFHPVPPMITPRASHGAIRLADGRVLVAGGWTGRRATAIAEVYDPATSRWVAVNDMIRPRMSPIVVPLPDGRVLVMGGDVRTGAPLASAEVFDPTTSTFSAVGPMSTSRGSHVALALADGRVLVTGGHRARGEILKSAEVFDPGTGEFHPTGDMGVPRHKHAAVLLADGRVPMVGGSDARDYRGRYKTTEFYDPETGEFSPGPNMGWGRHKIRDAVVVLPSGSVLVAGGATQPEVFHPANRVFVPVEGELNGPQMFATATRLATGQVLVLGGYDDRITSSASAWLIGTTR